MGLYNKIQINIKYTINYTNGSINELNEYWQGLGRFSVKELSDVANSEINRIYLGIEHFLSQPYTSSNKADRYRRIRNNPFKRYG